MSTHGDIIFTTTNPVTDKTVTFRIKAMVPLKLHLPENATEEDIAAVLGFEINQLCQKLRSKASYFRVENTTVLLHHVDVGDETFAVQNQNEEDTVSTLKKQLMEQHGKKSKRIDPFREVFSVSYYKRLTETSCGTRQALFSPIIRCDMESFKCVSLELCLDVLSVVNGDMLLSKLARVLSGSLCEQIKAMQYNLDHYRIMKTTYFTAKVTFCTPEVFHFLPPGTDFFVTTVYPQGLDDAATVDQRRCIHQVLSLPIDRPLFRRGSAFCFNFKTAAGYLINPHAFISPQHMHGKRVALVWGCYAYHHYMQDRFDDNRWGCAYRSLQTLVSWFQMQGYTNMSTPTHSQIQQALVDVGDKPSSFVGSKNWIGSFEVGLCLEKLIRVQSKFISVNKGSELESKGRELVMHFEQQGTPVMIGGGVLAHTILGVDFDESSGTTRFLILDPHYTADEDINTIIDKGWCGWKKSKFWDQNAMYNMCLPQRPKLL